MRRRYKYRVTFFVCLAFVVAMFCMGAKTEAETNNQFSVTAIEPNRIVAPGDDLELQVLVTADEFDRISYQWFQMKTSGVQAELMEGETSDILSLHDVIESADYVCIVQDSHGNSDSVRFFVVLDNKFSAYAVESEVLANGGATVRLDTAIEGIDLKNINYQWGNAYIDGKNDLMLAELPGETNSFYEFTVKQANYDLCCRVTDRFENVVYVFFKVKVNNHFSAVPEIQSIVTEPNGADKAVVIVKADDRDNLSYSWRVKYENGVWTELENEKDSILEIQSCSQNQLLLCIVRDQYGNLGNVHFNVVVEELDQSSPKLLGADVSANYITVTWTANSGVFMYAIFRKEAGGKWTKIYVTTGNENVMGKVTTGSTCRCFDSTAEAGKTYIYTVRGMDQRGKYVTDYDANGVSATITSQQEEQLDKSSPVLLGATASVNGITVTWKANRGVYEYAIFRKEAGGKWTKIIETNVMETAGSICSCLDRTAEAGKTYVYTVRGMEKNGSKYVTSYDTNGVSTTMVSQQEEQLDKSSPVLLGAEASADCITIMWMANSGVFKYAVFRKVTGGKWMRVGETTGSGDEAIKATAGTTCSFIDETAEEGTTYLYTVRGLDESGKYVTSYDANGVSCTSKIMY